VTHVITTIEIGGAENQLLILIRQQVKLGYSVKVIPLKGILTLKKSLEAAGAEVDLSLINRPFVHQIVLLRRILKPYKGVVHCHLPRAEVLGCISVKRDSCFIISRHYGSKFFPEKNQYVSSLLSVLVTQRATRVIAISESVKVALLRSYEVLSKDKIIVVPYGFDTQNEILHVVRSNESHLIRKDDEVSIAIVSRLSPEKRVELGINSFKYFLLEYPFAKLYIYGEGQEHEKLLHQVQTLSLEGNIFFMGKVMDLETHYPYFDVLLHTSMFEGFGMVYLEAIANNLPIVTSSKSGLIQSIIDSPGVIIPTDPTDPKSIAYSLIQALMVDKEKLQANYSAILAKFDSIKMAKSIIEVYTEVY
jgi:glycosyltransferase involved in cell wall biosynthesis